MGNIYRGKHRLLTACSLTVLFGIYSTAQAGGNGVIVLTRDVQPFAVGNPAMHPDPNPTTVNANPAVRITSASSELSDGDFASVSSGASITHSMMPNGNALPGLNTANGLPGMASGHGGGSGGSISNTINRSIEQGMSPLTALSQGK
ncbi:MAG: hypothetical protein KDI41_20395 [Pseudomonadales bacterium]|mgnify:FL=1|jgi:hypothetical protein|uniref:hypothetical protein n=1 Tax=Pseudomonas TaxID=286 RepID=UPI000287CE01|nr:MULTISPECIES: hypothetical protein [Pseudomonas]AMB79635.1 hypothetical protein AV641_11435 [Pseudomonas fragi]MCB1656158.1 hypothetical protein [Pseudomonadales bacterium]NBF15068.1 hypothetical protein [Pseudomonas sp. Fl4BN2]NNG64688.1 hypothetical protein [Pseudomonas sp. GC01]AUB75386.1 hypothetical protein B195_011265 [Pseudomonas sp. Lz4W]